MSDKCALEPHAAQRVEFATYKRNKLLDSLIHFQYHQYQCDSPTAMADLPVLRETIIGQENHRQQRRTNKRGRRDEALPVSLMSQTKRRALACITNQQLTARKRQTIAVKSCVRRQEPHSTENPWNPSLLSSLDPLNSSFMVTDTIDTDIVEEDNCAVGGEYARDTFYYLREAEVRVKLCITAHTLYQNIEYIYKHANCVYKSVAIVLCRFVSIPNLTT